MIKKYLWLILALVVTTPDLTYAGKTADDLTSKVEPNHSSSANQLQAKLNNIKTMTATFAQVVKAKQKKIATSQGTMALSRPGQFRWYTARPMPQLVIADGHRLWVYDVALEQVTVKKQQKHLGGAAALFLSGSNDKIANDFEVSGTKNNNLDYFDLKAKSNQANFERVKLVFRGETLQQIELYDQLGQQTDVQLSQVKINPKLAASLFKFKVPKGVDVVQQ